MKLTPSMSVSEFDNGYWYAADLKRFARALGIGSTGTLRKDQLEQAVRHFLHTREVPRPAAALTTSRERDVDAGLRLDRRVVRYTNDPETKAFLESEAKKLSPAYRRRSGARYRLNRWRDAQLAGGRRITYRDLVIEYVRLSTQTARFDRVPHGRYINFCADFLRGEPGATRAAAVRAWHALKRMDCPKTYAAWRKQRAASRKV